MKTAKKKKKSNLREMANRLKALLQCIFSLQVLPATAAPVPQENKALNGGLF